MRPIEVTGTVRLADGETVAFSLTKDLGWQQWGNRDEVLYASLPLVEALNAAAAEYLETEEDDE